MMPVVWKWKRVPQVTKRKANVTLNQQTISSSLMSFLDGAIRGRPCGIQPTCCTENFRIRPEGVQIKGICICSLILDYYWPAALCCWVQANLLNPTIPWRAPYWKMKLHKIPLNNRLGLPNFTHLYISRHAEQSNLSEIFILARCQNPKYATFSNFNWK